MSTSSSITTLILTFFFICLANKPLSTAVQISRYFILNSFDLWNNDGYKNVGPILTQFWSTPAGISPPWELKKIWFGATTTWTPIISCYVECFLQEFGIPIKFIVRKSEELLGINGRQDIPKYPMYFNGTLIFLHTTMISLRYIVAFLNIGWDVVVVVVIVLLNYRIDVFCHMKRSSVIRFRSFRSEIHQLTEKYRVVVVSVGDCFCAVYFCFRVGET